MKIIVKQTVSYYIKDYRMRTGISQSALARLLDTSRQLVDIWERGVSNPTGKLLQRFCALMEIGIDEIDFGD